MISLEGTFFGLVGSALITAVYVAGAGWSRHVLSVFVAGILGNFFDSYMGALFERRNLIGNDGVNFLNTAFAACIAAIMVYFW